MTATVPLALVADPKAPGTIYARVAGGGLFRTTHGGVDWEPLETGQRDAGGLVDLPVLALDAFGGPTLYALRRDELLQVTYLLRSRDGGRSWETLDAPPMSSTDLAVDAHTPGTVYAGAIGYGCSVARSTDWGESWRCLRGSVIGDASEKIVLDPSHPENLYVLGTVISASHNGGSSWGPASRGLPAGEISCLEVAPSQSEVLYAGTLSALLPSRSGIQQSTDRAATWHSASGNLPRFPGGVGGLAIDPRDARRVYANLGGTVYLSVTGGRTWQLAGVKPAISLPGLLLLDPNAPRTLYAASESRGFYGLRLPG